MLQSQDLKLETRRLILRRPLVEDAQNIQTLIDNWNVVKWLSRVPWPYPANGAAEWVERMSKTAGTSEQEHVFAMTIKSRPFEGVIGVVGLHRRDDAWEIGYWLGEPYWGNGYTSEAAGEVVRFAFEELGQTGLTSGHFFGNAGSARVLLRCGFEYTGESRRWCQARGHEVDSMELELTRAKWRAYQRPQAAE